MVARARKQFKPGPDLPAFARGVSTDFSKGVSKLGQTVDNFIPSRKRSDSIPGAMKNAPANRAALQRAKGR
jgi:hypothetical protein